MSMRTNWGKRLKMQSPEELHRDDLPLLSEQQERQMVRRRWVFGTDLSC